MTKRGDRAKDVDLTPLSQFEAAAKEVFSQSKAESDRRLTRFQASNKAQRTKAKKRKG